MKIIGFVFALIFPSLSWAQDVLSPEEVAALFPAILPSDVFESPIDGFYEVALDTSIAYVSMDGKYILQGDLYSIDSRENLSDLRRAEIRINMINSVDHEKTIVFSPETKNYKIFVFTDVDCGYCRQFHRDIDQVLDLGVEVEYLFYPRTGPNTESWSKAESVWCSQNRQEAITQAKATGSINAQSCFGSPVSDHFNLGQRVGIRGTPAIFDENGIQLGGYLSPEMLIQRLSELDPS